MCVVIMKSPIRGSYTRNPFRARRTYLYTYKTYTAGYYTIRICGAESKVQNLPLENTTRNLYDYKVIAITTTYAYIIKLR